MFFRLSLNEDDGSVEIERFADKETLLNSLRSAIDDDEGFQLAEYARDEDIASGWSSDTTKSYTYILLEGRIVTPTPTRVVMNVDIDDGPQRRPPYRPLSAPVAPPHDPQACASATRYTLSTTDE